MKEILLRIYSYIAAFIVWLWIGSLKVDYKTDNKKKLNPPNVAFAFWHNNIIILGFLYRFSKVATIVSQSKDGEYFSRLLSKFGYRIIRGSSSKGGTKALLEGIKVIKEGYSIAGTLDGPRGPGFKVKPGIIIMASKTGIPILPVYVRCHRAKILNTWDKMVLPVPFSSIEVHYGDLLFVPYDKTKWEEYRNILERKMMSFEV